MKGRPAVFLDRDGTLIEDNGYLKSPSQVVLYNDTITSLQALQKHYMLFIISNQSGISKGITTTQEVNDVNNYLLSVFKSNNVEIAEIFVCPHKTEDNCICKKPKAYFIQKAATKHRLNLAESYIIGDHPSDIECGLNASVFPLYVLTGHGKKHFNELKTNTIVCQNISEAADYIINNKK